MTIDFLIQILLSALSFLTGHQAPASIPAPRTPAPVVVEIDEGSIVSPVEEVPMNQPIMIEAPVIEETIMIEAPSIEAPVTIEAVDIEMPTITD